MQDVLIPKKLFWLPVLVVLALVQIMFKGPSLELEPPKETAQAPGGHNAEESTPAFRQLLCTNQQVTQGSWIPMTMERPPYIPLSPRVRCMRNEDFYKEFPTHVWKPNDPCLFTDWDAQQFTRLLSNQTILFVGDSLSLEHYASLVHLLGDRARLPPKAVQHNRIQRTICLNSTTPMIQVQSHCVRVTFKTDFRLHNISQQVQQDNPSVIVLNRGAHYVPDDELQKDLETYTIPAIREWNQRCDSTQSCLLVWRTTVPGHPFCHQFTQPVTSVPAMEDWIFQQSTNDSTVYRKGEFHWQDFKRQNELVMNLLLSKEEQLPNIRVYIMDSYQTNILRPDYHRAHMNDCLHSCSPGGGSDLNSQWLLHMLNLWKENG